MDSTYWQKQAKDTPLFPEILWSRPENKLGAGKLLIIGGSAHSIAAPLNAYNAAMEAGVGAVRVVLPEHVKKLFGKLVMEAEFAPSNPSGGFATASLDTLLMHDSWADTILLAGDFGRNSETSIVLEKLLQKTSKPVVVTQDAVECLYGFASELVNRPDTLVVVSFAQTQKLATSAKSTIALKFETPLIGLVEDLHNLTSTWRAGILTRHLNQFFVASKGEIVTSAAPTEKIWRIRYAARSSVFWLQNPKSQLKAVVSSLIP